MGKGRLGPFGELGRVIAQGEVGTIPERAAPPSPCNVLVISGLDPSGGAGFIADVRVVELLGGRAVGAFTALTEQDTSGVRAVHPVGAADLAQALTTLMTDVEIHAVKLGMLATADHAEVIGDVLALTAAPVVWDPILLPSRGQVALYDGDLRRAVRALAPHVALITPNRAEAGVLGGGAISDYAGAEAAAARIGEMGIPATLVKGGHFDGDAEDWLFERDRQTRLPGARLALPPGGVHGTGCALSTAIACRLALGDDLRAACVAAKAFVATRLASPVRAGGGRASVV